MSCADILTTRPFLVIYVVWHPAFGDGEQIARGLFDHYRRNLYANVAGGGGLPVVYRSTPAPGSTTPLEVDLTDARTSAIVTLIDRNWAEDDSWVLWLKELIQNSEVAGLSARVFPVAIDGTATQIGIVNQAARWDKWLSLSIVERQLRLVTDLTYQFCRMLRSYLEHLKRPTEPDQDLLQYLKKVEVFLSHSKHDDNGERVAKLIRDHLHAGEGLESFFDVHDIPIGLRFDAVLLQKVKVSAVVAVHTDSYSSREWCRREIIEAKRWNVPLVIVDCINDLDERGFPYLGNVPLVRMDPTSADRIAVVVSRLLDEVLKDFLWRCWVELYGKVAGDHVVFLPRPPELIVLATLESEPESETTLVYPEPPIGAEEQRLFEIIAPKVKLRSMTEWLAGEAV